MRRDSEVSKVRLQEIADDLSLQLKFQDIVDLIDRQNPYAIILLHELTKDKPDVLAGWNAFCIDYFDRKQNITIIFNTIEL